MTNESAVTVPKDSFTQDAAVCGFLSGQLQFR